MILFDTDACIELLRGNRRLIEKRKSCDGGIAVSFMSVAELYYGADKSDYRNRNISLVDEFLLSVRVIHSTIEICMKFGEIKARLVRERMVISDADIFIASTTLVTCEKLITGNVNHFERIAELRVENWLR